MARFTDSFLSGLLAAIGAPDNAQNRAFLTEWEKYEGAGTSHNPLATTQTWAGSWDYNDNNGYPVQNYASEADGIAATAKTLLNGRYKSIIGHLRGEDVPIQSVAAEIGGTWGTGGFANALSSGWQSSVTHETGLAGEGEDPRLTAPAANQSPIPTDAYEKWIIETYPIYQEYEPLLNRSIEMEAAQAVWDPDFGWVSYATDAAGNVLPGSEPTIWMTPEEYTRFIDLDQQVFNLEEKFTEQFGPIAFEEWSKRMDYIYDTDPRNTDHENTRQEFERQFDVVTQAAAIAANAHTAQVNHYDVATESQQANGPRMGTHEERNAGRGGPIVGSPGRFYTFDALFDKQLAKLREELPEVTPIPYHPAGGLTPPPPGLTVGGLREDAFAYGRSPASTTTGGATSSQPRGLTGAANITNAGRGRARADAVVDSGRQGFASRILGSTVRPAVASILGAAGRVDPTGAGLSSRRNSPAQPVQAPTVPAARPTGTPVPGSPYRGSLYR